MRRSSTPNPHPDPEVRAIDALFHEAGLARNLRGKAGGVTRRMNFEHATPEELSQAEPVPRVAPNGVQWLPVPGWEKIHWLWLGFSTRKGGSSRAWCAEGAPG